MNLALLINQPEGRRLEFKQQLNKPLELAKTIVAFANDAGGELIIGVQDDHRKLVGLPEDELLFLEEQISNIIFDHCQPIIVPEISFQQVDGAHFIRVHIHRGSNFPYYIKAKGKLEGTYIRVGSSNHLADENIIAELERQKRNVSYDSEVVLDDHIGDLDLGRFRLFYEERTAERLDETALRKLELVRIFQGKPSAYSCTNLVF